MPRVIPAAEWDTIERGLIQRITALNLFILDVYTEQRCLKGNDSSRAEPAQSHAWIEVHAPSHGRVPFDPTHNRPADERYVLVGHGRHYEDVPLNKGIYRGNARETLRAEVRTQVTMQTTPLTPQEGVLAIDLPVFNEAPSADAWSGCPGHA